MNVAICCIGKCENRYIKEFIEWYKNLGFSHIYLYDNNTIERFEEVIQNYIDDKFVTLIDFRKRTVCQLIAYKDCYEKYSSSSSDVLYDKNIPGDLEIIKYDYIISHFITSLL